jgi:hypothetical protein
VIQPRKYQTYSLLFAILALLVTASVLLYRSFQICRHPSQATKTTVPLNAEATENPETATMRPLGRHLMVDENGIIWDGKTRVGIWGVNGDHSINR